MGRFRNEFALQVVRNPLRAELKRGVVLRETRSCSISLKRSRATTEYSRILLKKKPISFSTMASNVFEAERVLHIFPFAIQKVIDSSLAEFPSSVFLLLFVSFSFSFSLLFFGEKDRTNNDKHSCCCPHIPTLAKTTVVCCVS